MKLTFVPEELDNDLKGLICKMKIKMHILANSLQNTLSKRGKKQICHTMTIHFVWAQKINLSKTLSVLSFVISKRLLKTSSSL